MLSNTTIFFSAALGSSFQEILHWYEKRFEISISDAKIAQIFTYLIVTILMILGCAYGTDIWMSSSDAKYSPRDAMVFGAAFPLIFKKAVQAAAAERPRLQLGGSRPQVGGLPPSADVIEALSRYFA
jgi:hypothetical protein